MSGHRRSTKASFNCMPRLYQLLNSRRLNNHVLSIGLVCGLLVLWLIGFLDFFREIDFKNFRWTPYVNVREQVARELTGLPSEYAYYNYWTDYEPLAQPTCKKNWLTRKKSLLIIVKTAPKREERRNAYRKTLSTVRQLSGYRMRTVFVLGKEEDAYNGSAIQVEADEHKDMLVGDFVDNYFNNTMKYIYSLKLARWHCFPASSVVPFVLLMDDDFMINLTNLISLLNKHQPNEQLYMGYRFDTSPYRLTFEKWRVSIEEYPFNAYPPFIAAGSVLYSPQAIKEFYVAVQHLKIFRFDDVYQGIIAYYLGYEPQMNPNFAFHRTNSISWQTKITEQDHSAYEIVSQFFLINTAIV